jgi:sec-independent protein translocase protein TatB
MFGIGFSELVLIGLVLILFIKPEDLPKFFRSAGKLYGQLKKAYDDVVSVKDKILKEIDEAATLEEKNAGNAAVPANPAVPPPRQLESPKPAVPGSPAVPPPRQLDPPKPAVSGNPVIPPPPPLLNQQQPAVPEAGTAETPLPPNTETPQAAPGGNAKNEASA